MKTVSDKFKVFRRSENTNSFGLHQLYIMNRQGRTYIVHMSYLNLPKKGDVVDVEFRVVKIKDEEYVDESTPIYVNHGSVELTSRLKEDASQEVVEEVFNL